MKVRIENDGTPPGTKVWLDDAEVPAVINIEFKHMSPGHPPEMRLRKYVTNTDGIPIVTNDGSAATEEIRL